VREEAFSIGTSILHRTDPRARLFAAFLYSMAVAVSHRLEALVPAACLGIILVFMAGLPAKNVLLRLLLVNGLILLLWFFIPFTYGKEPLWSLGPIMCFREGVRYVGILTIKSNTIILGLLALVATMSIFTLGRSLRSFKVPEKMVYLVFLTYRYIHVLHGEYTRLQNATKIRGFQGGTNLHTYRTYAYLLGMLFVKSYERAERVRAAMLCRGFSGRLHNLDEFELKMQDWMFLSAALGGVAVIGLLEWLAQ
jgi:cobalt/nickel transport system permease protein